MIQINATITTEREPTLQLLRRLDELLAESERISAEIAQVRLKLQYKSTVSDPSVEPERQQSRFD